jgi:NADPH2:quinone reductase
MRAALLTHFGPPEVLEIAEIDPPRPEPGEVLVRVVAASVNPVDAKIRAAGSWAGLQLPCVIGYDVSGVVEQLGPGVTDLAVGEEVFFTPEIFGNRWGAYAEYTVARSAIVARKPPELSHDLAAAIPLAGGTAYEAIVRRLRVLPGETVLIHGGAGGVGSFAVQIARAAGARVIATAGPENRDTLARLGVHVCVDYRSEDAIRAALRETGGAGVDAVFTTVGGDTVVQSLPALRPFGRIATILGFSGDLSPLYLRNQELHGVFLLRERARLEALGRLAARGQIVPLVDDVLPLERLPDAHHRMDSGHGRGKIVIRITG